MARLTKGGELAKTIIASLRKQAPLALKSKRCAFLLDGRSNESSRFVDLKARVADELGIVCMNMDLANVNRVDALNLIRRLNDDSSIAGIVLQLPLPISLPTSELLDAVDPSKDIDCLGAKNLSEFLRFGEQARFVPCAAAIVLHIIDESGVDLTQVRSVVLGRGDDHLVAVPTLYALTSRKAPVALIDPKSEAAEDLVRDADVIIAAGLRSSAFPVEWIKPNAVIIDFGAHYVEGKLVGDAPDNAIQRAAIITPVPGGVGPLIPVFLFRNFFSAVSDKP
eukprot:TRINITY_DN2118_c0_g2_i1.p1 TRINITY_DN2118_c0_g2~~TRINITY_DN2118_c0_g2_i1.p1  ORF type:complete len:280 (-),score=46.73 TRINITY_DN2118_c0_g2_i1:98-937(-)